MELTELKETHAHYKKMQSEWELYNAAHEGTKALIDHGVLRRNKNESEEDFKIRKKSAYGFSYSSRLIDIVSSYITQKPSSNEYGDLAGDELFKLFLDNSDKCFTSYQTVIDENQKEACVFGYVGVLVDKSNIETKTRSQDLALENYPFLSTYSARDILDWRFDVVNKSSCLSYLKLRDDDRYTIWAINSWEIWQEKDDKALLIDSGDNPLGEIPFTFHQHKQSHSRTMAGSMIREIARMDVAILRRLSATEEVFDMASFPTRIEPMLPPGVNDNNAHTPSGIIKFDPKYPESKPEWMKTEIKQPAEAVMDWLAMIVEEMYKSIHANSLNTGTQTKSGDALKREFQALNAELGKIQKSVETAERSILRHWLMWQGKLNLWSQISVSRPMEFDISSLLEDLDNLNTSRLIVSEEGFQKAVKKAVVRKTLPNLSTANLEEIDNQIDAVPEE